MRRKRLRRKRVVVASKAQPTGISLGAHSDEYHTRVKARIAATGETKTKAQLWVWTTWCEPQFACARPGCGHELKGHEDGGPAATTHRCLVVGCNCVDHVAPPRP
jgi:hypothetical protein